MLLKIPDWVILPGIVFVLPLAFYYAMLAFVFGSKLAVRQIARITVIFVVVLVPLFLVFGSMPASWRENVAIVLSLACATAFWTLILTYRIRKIKAGSLLLDMGLSRLHVCNLILLVILIICIFIEIAGAVVDNLGLEEVSRALAWLSIGAYALFLGSGRIQIREHGIFYFRHLIRWERITGYGWDEGKRNVLSLKLDRKLPLFWEVHLLVPAQYRDCVGELLSQNVAL
jgi:uncharacterized membrane protein YobD (UPF0266 family)